eukprot:350193-Chlamydomonas_euryale.AAC.3
MPVDRCQWTDGPMPVDRWIDVWMPVDRCRWTDGLVDGWRDRYSINNNQLSWQPDKSASASPTIGAPRPSAAGRAMSPA